MNESAKTARNAYYRKYYADHRDQILAEKRKAYSQNPDHYLANQKRYWERKAARDQALEEGVQA